MKIVHLISSGGFYGAENMLHNLLAGLRELSADVSLCVFSNQDGSIPEIASRSAELGIDVTLIPCNGRFDLHSVRQLRRILVCAGIDVLHTHGYKADLYGFLATRSTGIRIVATCHNWTHGSRALSVYAMLDKFCLRAFDSVVAVSAQVANELRQSGVPLDRLRQIANGVAVPGAAVRTVAADSACAKLVDSPGETAKIWLEDELEKEFVTVAVASRLVADKGISEFLYAAREGLTVCPAARFTVAGDGPDRERFEAEAAALGISHAVTFPGFVADMAALYRSIDLFVLPSLREGLPMSLLEAMAAGKAVIATRVGAIPDVIEDNQTGLLVEPGDREALAEAMKQLLRNRMLREALGVKARHTIHRSWSAEAMSSKYLALYNGIDRGRATMRSREYRRLRSRRT